MSNNLILAVASPLTQSAEAVKQLIAYQTYGREPKEMPPFYRLGADMALVQSNKGDAYYVTTPKTCSCPSATYHPGQLCKHSRKYFPQPKREALPTEAVSERTSPLIDLIRPTGKWPGGFNGPVNSDSIKVVA